jgi:hypothetical protein
MALSFEPRPGDIIVYQDEVNYGRQRIIDVKGRLVYTIREACSWGPEYESPQPVWADIIDFSSMWKLHESSKVRRILERYEG